MRPLRFGTWSWFSFHADQRTKMFNYFVASSAFLVAGYASAASSHLWSVAVATGLLGCPLGQSSIGPRRDALRAASSGRTVARNPRARGVLGSQHLEQPVRKFRRSIDRAEPQVSRT